MPLPAVLQSVWVPLPPEAAFALFTQRTGLWWPFVGHSCSGEAGQDIRFEHSDWEACGDAAAAKRDQYEGGWPATLAACARAAKARP
jgi:hypothetical protein